MKYFPDPPQPQVPPVELLPLPTGRDGAGAAFTNDRAALTDDMTTAGEAQTAPTDGLSDARTGAVAGIPQQPPPRSVGTAKGIDVRQPIVNEFLESGNLEANSRRAYERSLRRFLGWSTVPFAEVTPRQVSQYRDWLESEPSARTGKPLARASVNQEVAALKVFFGWLSLHYPHHCPHNPTGQIKQRQVSVSSPDDISAAALDWIWSTLPELGETTVRDTLLVHLLSHGLRASEIVELNLASFDGEALFLSQTKNHSSRIVPLSRASILVMEQYLDWRRTQLALPLEPELPLVISLHVARVGQRLGYKGVYQAVARIGRKARERCILGWLEQMEQQDKDLDSTPPLWWTAAAGLRLAAEIGNWDEVSVNWLIPQMPHEIRHLIEELADLHPHNFRHTYATQLLLRGLDPAHARKLTGHQSQQVFRRYTQRAEQQAAIEAFRRMEESGGSVVPVSTLYPKD